MLTRPAWYVLRALRVALGASAVALGAWYVSAIHPAHLVTSLLSALMVGLLVGFVLPAPWTYKEYRRRLEGRRTEPAPK